MPERNPDVNQAYREQKGELMKELGEVCRDYDDAIVVEVLNDMLSKRVSQRAHNEFCENWTADHEQED